MGAALKFRQTQLGRQAGEIARLKIARGPDSGITFVITGPKVSIGRGDENDIVLSDLKASRKHCEFTFDGHQWSVKDAGSVNGISLNGKASRGGPVRTRDTVGLGETLFEFFTPEAGTMVLVAAPVNAQQLREEQANMDAQRARIQAMGKFGGLAKNAPRPDQLGAAPTRSIPRPPAPSAPSQGLEPKKIAMIGAALVAAYMFFGDNTQPPKPKKPVEEKKDASSERSLPPADDSVAKTADTFFRTGFREYRQGNFLRAKIAFENVLQMAPTHRLAKIYLKNAETRIEDDVKNHLDFGRKALDAGKLSEAKGDFETVMRLLFRDQENPAYIEARDQLVRVKAAMAEGGS